MDLTASIAGFRNGVRRALALAALVAATGVAAAETMTVNMTCSKDVAPSNRVQVQINTQNAPYVHLTVAPIDGAAWLKKSLLTEKTLPEPNTTGGAVTSWDTRIANKNQAPNPNGADTFYSRQINLPKLSPGVYLVVARAGKAHAWAVATVSNLAVELRRSPERMLVWVTDALKGNVKSGAKIEAYSNTGKRVVAGVTGADGAAMISIPPGTEAVLVSLGSDLAGIASAATNPDGRLVAHFQTDRPIYRPGQTVSYKAILRRTSGQGYVDLADRPVTVQLKDAKDDVIDQKSMHTNAMGTIADAFELPAEAMLGSYTIAVKQAKDEVEQSFEVAEYRKPEFQATIVPVRKRYLAGEKIEFSVQVNYFFGSPVPDAHVQFVARTSPNNYFASSSRGFDDGNLYPRDTYRANPVVGDDVVTTDKNGRATITLNTAKSAPDLIYSVAAAVTDSSRRQIQARGSVPVYAAAKRIGLRTDVIVATLGSLIPVEIRVADLDDKPTSAKVRLRVLHRVFDDKKNEEVEKMLVETEINVPEKGSLTYNLPARSEGDLIIEASSDDGTGRRALTRMWVEVVGNFGPNQRDDQEPTLNIRLDKPTYLPGSDARAYITTNTPGHAMLFTVEGQDIWAYKVVTKGRAGQLWTISTARKMSPNAVVTACEWVKGSEISGSEQLYVPDPSRHLNVSVIPDKRQYEAGDKANMTVRVVTDQARPVHGEISLAVVDEAINAISPDSTADPYDTFWGPRDNLVSHDSSAPEELSGGAYQNTPGGASAGRAVPVRSRFVDTALWAGIVETDANGEAHLHFDVPGNLTTWRATAYGVNADTSVGKGMTSVLANRPVMLRLATPRQIVVGDKLTLIGTVNNRTDFEHTFRVKLSCTGSMMMGPSVQDVKVEAKGEGHVEWTLTPDMMTPGAQVTLHGEVEATDSPQLLLADALQVSVPLMPRAVQERILTGGTLQQSARFQMSFPVGSLQPNSLVDVTVKGGLRDVLEDTTKSILATPRYSSPMAIDQLVVAAATHQDPNLRQVRDAMAMLARDQQPDGWGWWEGSPAKSSITSSAIRALVEAKKAHLPVYARMFDAAVAGGETQYDQINLWDARGILVGSLAEAGSKRASDMIDEIVRRGTGMSPYAQLRVAMAEHALGQDDDAKQHVEDVMKLVSRGSESAYLPVGEGIGWSADSIQTTAEALIATVELKLDFDLQAQMARWLAVSEDSGWRSTDDEGAVVRALAAYSAVHPSARLIGPVTLKVNGVSVQTAPAKVGQGATARIPVGALHDGSNVIELERTEPGEAFFSVDARVYAPRLSETTAGIRVLRRIEVQNAAGIWGELDRPVKAGEPVRITIVAWGDDLPDAVRVLDPLPAGFEFVGDETEGNSREEVRDAAVIHYLVNDGLPQTFRYFIRAESEGRLNALPVQAEFLRRPTTSGQTNAVIVTVVK